MARIINKDNWREVRDDLYRKREEYDKWKSRSTGNFLNDYHQVDGNWVKKSVVSPDQFGE